MDSSLNLGSIGIAGPPLRGPSSPRLLSEPPLSPPVSGPSPTASAQPLEPVGPLAPLAPTFENASSVDSRPPEPRPPASLESLLMRFRLITTDQLDEALREQRATGRDVGAIIVERGWINEDQLARLLSYAPAFSPAAESPAEANAEPAPAHEPESGAVPPVADGALSHEIAAETGRQAELDQHPEPEPEADAQREPEPEAESAIPSAGPVISAGASQPADAVSVQAHPLLSISLDVPPALELVEPETSVEPESSVERVTSVEAEPAVEAAEPKAPSDETQAPIAEFPIHEPEAEATPVELAPIAPVAPAAETVASTAAPPEPEPEPVPVPVAEEPAPATEHVAVPEPPAPAPAPQAVRVVEPTAIETIARVFVRLSNGERVEAGSFNDVTAAKARAEEVVREVSNGGETWPFFGGRYIRPDVVVSVDVDATVVRYA